MAEIATDRLRLCSTENGWPLDEMWVAGALLEPADEIDHGTVVLMIDLQPDELPWLAVHPTAEWIGEQLRLGKRPISWTYRPMTWPAWNVRNRQITRFWSAGSGLDHAVIDAVRSGAAADLVEPNRGEVDEQLAIELEAAKGHLQSILERYWDQDWRRDNRHHTSPEDQLWRAATAVNELATAIIEHGA